MTRAIYPGSFDPLTSGHVDIVERALQVFDEVIVAVARNISKSAMFSVDERLAMIRETFPDEDRLIVDAFEGLLVEYARDHGASVIVRGLRAVADFEYEYQMAGMNSRLEPTVETVFLMADRAHFFVSSGLVKEVAQLGGDIDGVVPAPARRRLLERVAEMKNSSG